MTPLFLVNGSLIFLISGYGSSSSLPSSMPSSWKTTQPYVTWIKSNAIHHVHKCKFWPIIEHKCSYFSSSRLFCTCFKPCQGYGSSILYFKRPLPFFYTVSPLVQNAFIGSCFRSSCRQNECSWNWNCRSYGHLSGNDLEIWQCDFHVHLLYGDHHDGKVSQL